MPGFVVQPEDVQGESLVLRNGEAEHLVRVRRHRVGQEIEVIDGCGHFYRARIGAIARREVHCDILSCQEERGESPVRLSLAPALIKGARFDGVVEKATEVGVASITPLLTERGVVRPGSSNKLARWQRLVQAAAKQCGRSRWPALQPPGFLEEVVRAFTEHNDVVLMATPGVPGGVRGCLAGKNAVRLGLLVGPEGGFSTAEQEWAREAGVTLFSWGERTLRADTASMVLAALVLYEAEQARPAKGEE